MIIFRLRRGRWSPLLAKEFRRTRRDKPTLLMSRISASARERVGLPVYGDPGQMRLHCQRWSRRRDRRRPSSSRPKHRGQVLGRDGLMHCVTAKRGRHELQDLEAPSHLTHRHDRTNPNGKPLASAAAHHQLRHGASVWPF